MSFIKFQFNRLESYARFLLAGILLFSSINYFFQLLSTPEMAIPGFLFFQSIIKTNYLMELIKGIEFVAAILFLINRYVFQATLIVFPIVFNILLFHLFLDFPGLSMAIVLFVLLIIIMISKKQRYLDLFKE